MEEYEFSYADNNRAMNYGWAKNFGSMKNLSAHASPKLSARNSYTGDSPDDFNDVFGGPPKYISLKQFKDPRKAHSLLQPPSGFPGLVPSNIPVFGETRRRYANDEFYDDIFNGDAASNAGDMSDKCSVASRSTSRNLSPAQSPLPSAEYKAFGSISPLAPKPRQNVKSSKQTEFPLFGISSHHGPSKFYNDSSVVSSAQSSPRDHSSDLLEMPFGRCTKPPKALAETRQQGLKKQQEIAVLPPRSSKSRYQPFLEPGESILDTPARLSHDKLYSTAQTTSCSHTSDDELGDNIQGLSRHISVGVCKPDVEKRGPDNTRGSNSGEKEEDNGFEKPRSSASSGTSIKHFEKPRSSASSATSIKHQRPAASHPSDSLQLQHQLKSWRDWFQEPKVSGSNRESGSLSMGSSGLSSAREVHANIGTSSVQGVSQEIGLKRLSTTGIDSGEESDDLGSYVIEIDAKRGETIAFLPEREIQIDTSNALNSSISSTKEKIKNSQKESLLHRPVQNTDHDAKGGKFRVQSLSQKKYNFDPLGELEAKMQTLQTNKGKDRSKESSKILSTQHIHERSAWPVPTPAVEQGTKEALIKEAKKEALRDPYFIDPSTMVKEVFNKIEKWHCEQPAVFHEMPQTLERNDSADGTTAKETIENRRKRLEKECQLRTKERVSKILVEKKQKELEAEEEQAEKTKTSEKLDSEIKRWSAGKEGNIRALLSTLQYVLWPDSGWRPVPLIEIIEGVAVKKAYQKARLCVHPDKLQQKGATVQQKYIAEKVFNILQEAWTIFNSMDPF